MRIKIGDKIRIKENLKEVCESIGMELFEDFYEKWNGTTQEVLDIWKDGKQEYITIDLCVEIPIECVELV